MNDIPKKYLKPTYFIDSNHPSIQEKSREIVSESQDVKEQAIRLFYFVREQIKYNFWVWRTLPEYFKASNTLSNGMGYCVQKAVLLTALARAAGIPAGLGFARLRNHLLPQKVINYLGGDIMAFHGYTTLYIDGKWIKATPAFDSTLCHESRLVPVEFDAEHDAIFHSYNVDGQLHIEYLKYYGHYDDLPLEKLWKELIAVGGRKVLEPPPR
jgi:transglutaminase-like putative cysteine protease